jgi:antitoxin (DNA-binding transcriptional repressor) of toxin-antitoxin stability system
MYIYIDMKYITTTDLRTLSSQLVDSLKQGKKISLVHRSQIIGEISPIKKDAKIFDIKKFRVFIKTPLEGKSLNYQKRDQLYRKHLEAKYGKNLS